MLRNILLIPMILATFAVADGSINDIKMDNQILKLKLEVFKLKEKNSQLEKVIESFSTKLKEKEKEAQRRANAIAQLKRDLRNSRRLNSTQVLLLK